MSRIDRKRPSPALVVATLALVAALAGSAVAEVATTAKLSKKEKKQVRKIARKQVQKRFPVSGSDLADGAVTRSKLADGAVGAAKLAEDAVDASKIRAGSLGTRELSRSIPAARVTRSALLQIDSATETTVGFDAERYDTAGMHSNTANNSRLTAPVTGIYQVTAQVTWASSGGGFREVWLTKNGSTDIASNTVFPAGGGQATRQQATTQVRLQAGDRVEVRVEQDSGGQLPLIKQDEFTPEFSMTWLAPGP